MLFVRRQVDINAGNIDINNPKTLRKRSQTVIAQSAKLKKGAENVNCIRYYLYQNKVEVRFRFRRSTVDQFRLIVELSFQGKMSHSYCEHNSINSTAKVSIKLVLSLCVGNAAGWSCSSNRWPPGSWAASNQDPQLQSVYFCIKNRTCRYWIVGTGAWCSNFAHKDRPSDFVVYGSKIEFFG